MMTTEAPPRPGPGPCFIDFYKHYLSLAKGTISVWLFVESLNANIQLMPQMK